MTDRERFIATLTFQKPDRIPLHPGYGRKSTLAAWHQQGLPCEVNDCIGYAFRQLGIPVPPQMQWVGLGVQCNSPMEVAAGNDLPALRKQYGTQMAYRGGVDKRAMARGGKALRAEIDRLAPAIRSGGIVPGCDHGIPADVSWPNFVEYCRLLAEVTGWA